MHDEKNHRNSQVLLGAKAAVSLLDLGGEFLDQRRVDSRPPLLGNLLGDLGELVDVVLPVGGRPLYRRMAAGHPFRHDREPGQQGGPSPATHAVSPLVHTLEHAVGLLALLDLAVTVLDAVSQVAMNADA